MSLYKVVYSNSYLSHHGILGQKWGVRNGPPYPLDAEDRSASEKRLNNSARRKESDTSYSNELDQYEISQERKRQLIRAAKILGFTAGTAACALGIAYLLSDQNVVESITENTQEYFQTLEPGFNISGSNRPYSLATIHDARNGFANSFVGIKARNNNLDVISDVDEFSDLLNNPLKEVKGSLANPDKLIKEMRVDIIEPSAQRRLSCWSGSQAYFLSNLTGEKFASKSYENLVDFNDFGRLYKNSINIFDVHGNSKSNFVGKFGHFGARGGKGTADELITNILNNVSERNNLSADGSRTIGFINAGYYNATCTHEWNFEVGKLSNGLRDVYISDSYTGERYKVAKEIISNGEKIVKFDVSGRDKLASELRHYGEDSIRFYAPSLKDVDPKQMANVVLKEINIKHGVYIGYGYRLKFIIT